MVTPVATAFRPSPPDPAAYIRWPRAFGTRFLVTVDTEEEFDWGAPLSREARAVTAVQGLPEGHRWFAERGVPLCFLTDYPIASDARAAGILRGLIADGRSTVGTQLHPWVNPPFDEPVTQANSFPGNLSRALEAAKIDRLTDTIARAIGVTPRIYRSGRYGIGPATLGLLAERGYRIDSSIRARYDYAREGGPDFTAIGNAAYRLAAEDGLIELPLTTVFTGALRGVGSTLYAPLGRVPRGRGAFARLGLLSRVALTPEDMPIADALAAVQIAVGEGERLLVFSFHSPSLVPGHTPYVRNVEHLAKFYGWWRLMLDQLATLGVTPASSDEVIDALDRPE